MLQQFIGRDIVMGGVQADVFRSEAKGMSPKIIHGIQEVQAVMAGRAWVNLNIRGNSTFSCSFL